jgi:hypothetical protein
MFERTSASSDHVNNALSGIEKATAAHAMRHFNSVLIQYFLFEFFGGKTLTYNEVRLIISRIVTDKANYNSDYYATVSCTWLH